MDVARLGRALDCTTEVTYCGKESASDHVTSPYIHVFFFGEPGVAGVASSIQRALTLCYRCSEFWFRLYIYWAEFCATAITDRGTVF